MQPSTADVLIIGSSLIQVPSVRCDDEMLLGKTRYDPEYYSYIFQYDKARYLQSLLREKLGAEITALNGAVAATTVADQFLLFKSFLDHGGSTKLVMLCLSPRELHDNYHPVPEKSQVYQMIGNPFAAKAIKERGFESCLGMVWERLNPLFADRLQLQRAAANLEEQIVRGSMSQQSRPQFRKPANTLRDLEMWRNTYNPVHWDLYHSQISYLERFLSLAKERNIPLVIVDMPLPRENVALIDDGLKRSIAADLQSLSQQYHAELIHPGQEQPYYLSDFEDGGHMVSSGGRKLFCRLSDFLSQTPSLRSQLIGATSRPNM